MKIEGNSKEIGDFKQNKTNQNWQYRVPQFISTRGQYYNNQVEGACHSVLQKDELASLAVKEC